MLSRFQALLNNLSLLIIIKTFNKLVYEFKFNKSLNLIIIINLSQFIFIKINVIDAICYERILYF